MIKDPSSGRRERLMVLQGAWQKGWQARCQGIFSKCNPWLYGAIYPGRAWEAGWKAADRKFQEVFSGQMRKFARDVCRAMLQEIDRNIIEADDA